MLHVYNTVYGITGIKMIIIMQREWELMLYVYDGSPMCAQL